MTQPLFVPALSRSSPMWAISIVCLMTLCLLGGVLKDPFVHGQVDSGDAIESPATLVAPDVVISNGWRWLLKQQAADGSFPSETYGVMRTGVGTTALVMQAISESPIHKTEEGEKAFLKARDFLIQKTQSHGLVTAPGERGDSPVYATALLLTATRMTHPLLEEKRSELFLALKKAQQIPENGWPESATGRGGWGIEADPQMAESNPANLSVTVHVLNALSGATEDADRLSENGRLEALNFLNRCRDAETPTAGFWFLPRVSDHLNKGGFSQDADGQLITHPYHSATSDGIRALQTLGAEELIEESGNGLLHSLLNFSPAPFVQVPEEEDQELSSLSGLFFYDAASFASVQRFTDPEACRLESLWFQATILNQQNPDGSWSNPISWMREDDPLIATALSLIALSRFEIVE